jgi:hypothetical protein
LGGCLLWAVFANFRRSVKIIGLFFTVQEYILYIFDKTWVGLHFGLLFYQLIWSFAFRRHAKP